MKQDSRWSCGPGSPNSIPSPLPRPRGTDPRVPNTSPEEHRLTFLLEDTVIYLSYSGAESATGSQLIMMRFKNPTPGIWKIRVHNELFIQGEYNIWLPTAGLISENTFFLRPDPNTIITEPGNTAGAITVAAYNHRNNSIYIHSSRGYTRLGTIKPDLAAPGSTSWPPITVRKPEPPLRPPMWPERRQPTCYPGHCVMKLS